MHIVVFPGWYPTRLDNLSGDFIQRHMRAIALKCKVTVIIPLKDKAVRKVDRVEVTNGNLTEIYIYYPSFSSIELIDNFVSFVRYTHLAVKTAIGINGLDRINLVHLYVLQKNQLLGFLLNGWLRVPFVVSEQSTFYVDGGLEKAGWLPNKVRAYIFSRANSIHAVSHYLLNHIRTKLSVGTEGVVIPNVVDTSLFTYRRKSVANPVTFVHVSNMVRQKNVEGMLEAFKRVKSAGMTFKLNLVGPITSIIASIIQQLDLQNEVVIWGERKYTEVAEIMNASDFFVFFTRYETFGCVIIEANACGLPVIATNLEVTQELIKDNVNGLFVKNEDVEDLADKISIAITHYNSFNRELIAEETARRFNYLAVASQFEEWYKSVLRKS